MPDLMLPDVLAARIAQSAEETTADDREWRYLAGRKVRHDVGPVGRAVTLHEPALCGIAPEMHGYWLGTGSQRESQRVLALAKCTKCVGFLARTREALR